MAPFAALGDCCRIVPKRMNCSVPTGPPSEHSGFWKHGFFEMEVNRAQSPAHATGSGSIRQAAVVLAASTRARSTRASELQPRGPGTQVHGLRSCHRAEHVDTDRVDARCATIEVAGRRALRGTAATNPSAVICVWLHATSSMHLRTSRLACRATHDTRRSVIGAGAPIHCAAVAGPARRRPTSFPALRLRLGLFQQARAGRPRSKPE